MATPTSLVNETITMVIINDRREVLEPLDRVWDIVADVDNNPVHWPNLRTVDNISKDGIVNEREVTEGFRKSKSHQTILLMLSLEPPWLLYLVNRRCTS
jgi:hypothetical protein